MKLIDLKGLRFGSVLVIKQVGVCKSRDAKWMYLCDCGVTNCASGYRLRSGKTKSCQVCARLRTTNASITHGETDSPEYRTWTDMKTRCMNKEGTSYANYGGRGISICQRWIESFDAFLVDMGKKPDPSFSIDRIDNNGNYEPANCRWTTTTEQNRNKRNSVKITIRGEVKPLVKWCEQYECTTASAYERRAKGYRGEDIFISHIQKIEFKGVTNSVSWWAQEVGIKPNTLSMRINKYQWPIEKALTEGVKKCA